MVEADKETEENLTFIDTFYVCFVQYQMMENYWPAALCEPQRSPLWSSWLSSPVSVTISV